MGKKAAAANDTEKAEPAHKSVIPLFEECTDEQRARIEEIIARADTASTLSAVNFGSDALDELSAVTEKISKQMNADMYGNIGALVKEYDTSKNSSFLNWQDDFFKLIDSQKTKSRGFLRGLFNMKAKEPTPEEEAKKAASTAQQLDRIEQRLRTSIISFKEYKRKLEMVKTFTLPGIARTTDLLEQTHANAYESLMLYNIASRELGRRVTIELHELDSIPEKETEREKKRDFLEALETRQSILLQALASNVNGSVGVGIVRDHSEQVNANISFLLDIEMELIHKQIVHASRTLDHLRSRSMAHRIGKSFEAQRAQAQRKAEAFEKRIEKFKDAPETIDEEQLKRIQEDMERTRDELEKRGKAVAQFRASVDRQEEKLSEERQKFIVEQALTYADWAKTRASAMEPKKIDITKPVAPVPGPGGRGIGIGKR